MKISPEPQKIQIQKFNRMLKRRATRKEKAFRLVCVGGPYAGNEILMTQTDTLTFRASGMRGRYTRMREDQQNARIWGLNNDAARWIAA